jgi:hypothetical protein
MMGYYLLDNPPASQQFYPSRNGKLSGGVVLHTTESPADRTPPDNGARNVAGFISRRSDPGSYHVIVDSQNIVPLLPASYTAFHVAASGYNSTTYGVSIAARTTDLHPDDPWTQAAVLNAARAMVGFWEANGFDPVASARWIAAPDTRTTFGVTTHGDAQPADRSDAWTRHPHRPALDAMLVACVRQIVDPPPDPDEDDVKPVIVVDPRPGKSAWHVFGNTRYRLASQAEIDVLTYMGVQVVTGDAANPDPIVNWLRSCKDLGRPVEK